MERTITIQQIKDAAQEAYNLYKDNTDGKNADYIPYLANIDPKLFGISICLMNGEIIQLGDSQYRFGIESVSKVLTAILVLRQYGAPKVLEMIAPTLPDCRSTPSCYPVGKRPPFHPTGKRRGHLGRQHGTTPRQQRRQMESHRRQYDRTMRKCPATD